MTAPPPDPAPMPALTANRQALAAWLAGLPAGDWPAPVVHAGPPPVLTAPAYVVDAGEPWVTAGEALGELVARWFVQPLVSTGEADALGHLEALVSAALDNPDDRFTLVDTTAPTAVSYAGAEYLTATLTLTSPI